MTNSPSVSVVIPLHNGERFIERSIKSVLRQSFTDFELIVVDDGSTDGGWDILHGIADSRLRLVRQANGGVSAARNRGIAEGRGEYFGFLDADDEWDTGFLDATMRLVALYPRAGVYGTGYRIVYPKGPVVEITAQEARYGESAVLVTDYFVRANGGSLIHASGVVIPRSVFEEVGRFKAGEPYGEDLEMWSRIALRYPVGYDTRILFSYNQTGAVNKSRFSEVPRYEPHVQMLQAIVANPPEHVRQVDSIKAHIRARCLQTCFWFVSYSTRVATLVFVEEGAVQTWRPNLARIAITKQFWPFLRLAAHVHRLMKSRFFMRMLGGQRVSHGVLIRLVPR